MATAEAAGVAATVVVGAVKFFTNGNYSQMVEKSKMDSLDSFIVLPDGRRIKGQHFGQRHVSECKRSMKTLYSPRYKVYANGKGEFISPELRYTGQFIVNRFYGHGEAIYDFPHNDIQRYVGEFQHGARCRSGKLYLRDELSKEYLYFDGSWKDDQPWTGAFYDKKGTEMHQIAEGRRVATTQVTLSVDSSSTINTSSTASPIHGQPSPASVTAPVSPIPPQARPTNGRGSTVELNEVHVQPRPSEHEVRHQRILLITAEETSYAAMKRLQVAERLAAVLQTRDGTLIHGVHIGPRRIVRMPEPEYAPLTLWCCFFARCCRSQQPVYYLRAEGKGEFTNSDPAHPVRFRGKFIDGRTVVPEDLVGRDRFESGDSTTSVSEFSDPHPAVSGDWGALSNNSKGSGGAGGPTLDAAPDVDIDEHEVLDDSSRNGAPIPSELKITGRVRLVTAAKLIHGKKLKKGSVLKAEVETADGQWVPGYHEGRRRKVKPAGNVFRSELIAEGQGYFQCRRLHFRYDGPFVNGQMTGLAVNGGLLVGGIWTVPPNLLV